MKWVTKLSEKSDVVLKACRFCAERDPTFHYEVKDKQVWIFSHTRDQAFKRGSYFHLKFGTFYNVERVVIAGKLS